MLNKNEEQIVRLLDRANINISDYWNRGLTVVPTRQGFRMIALKDIDFKNFEKEKSEKYETEQTKQTQITDHKKNDFHLNRKVCPKCLSKNLYWRIRQNSYRCNRCSHEFVHAIEQRSMIDNVY
ncbi:MAG: hypothetical protein DRO67_05215 [Candidatus Asgardarchaeum californiense]|nr:MAG: hypothetical protein DRO67_05215 [Candidatus Asgardarchaeum californiense]